MTSVTRPRAVGLIAAVLMGVAVQGAAVAPFAADALQSLPGATRREVHRLTREHHAGGPVAVARAALEIEGLPAAVSPRSVRRARDRLGVAAELLSPPRSGLPGLVDAARLVSAPGYRPRRAAPARNFEDPTLPSRVREPLAALLAAFHFFRSAASDVFVPGAPPAVPIDTLIARRVDLARAVLQLRDVLEETGPIDYEVTTAPGISIDLGGADNTYSSDFDLLIDAGGNDVYLNNSGGNGGPVCVTTPSRKAAALIDLGGDDIYATGRGCGSHGGGSAGAGLLFDASGNDIYQAAHYGVIGGGAFGGLGLLIDGGGVDEYTAGNFGVNGGGFDGGTGLLIDGGGNDVYTGKLDGVNGGAWEGQGNLIDFGGDDSYTGTVAGVNGGGAKQSMSSSATGFLLDATGSDAYRAGDVGTNGGGGGFNFRGAAGMLVDGSGDDTYTAGETGTNGGGIYGGLGVLVDGGGTNLFDAHRFGTNGGGYGNGAGFLVGGPGNDRYVGKGTNPQNGYVESYGTNGGGGYGAGFLFDAGGSDQYEAAYGGANGGAQIGRGFLLDLSGMDVYTAVLQAVNGGAIAGPEGSATAALVDLGGDDLYSGGDYAVNGGARGDRTASAVLFDLEGNDRYLARSFSTNGGAHQGAKGLLLDGGGSDFYEDFDVPSGSGTDRTVIGKGSGQGAQIDVPRP